MKITPGFKVRGFILAAAFSAGLGFGTSASAQVLHSYLVDLNSKTVTDIGDLGSSIDFTRAFGINDAGQVVGYVWPRLESVTMLSSPALMGWVSGTLVAASHAFSTVVPAGPLASMTPGRWWVGLPR